MELVQNLKIDHRKEKYTGFRHMRTCKRCGKIFYTVRKFGRICPNCDTRLTWRDEKND